MISTFGYLIHAHLMKSKPLYGNSSRIYSALEHLDLDGEVSSSSQGHTKDFQTGTTAGAGHTELEYGECLNQEKAQFIPYTMNLHLKVE